MTASGTIFVGYDGDGDKVYRMPDNTYMGRFDSEEKAEAAWHASVRSDAVDREAYEQNFGKITREKPADG